MKKRIVSKVLLTLGISLFLSACSGEELLEKVPETLTLEEVRQQIAEEWSSGADRAETVASEALVKESPETGVSFLEDGFRYAYNSLDQAEQIWYQDIEEALGTMRETVQLSGDALAEGLGEDSIDHIFQCVLIDHPEIFYTDGYSYTRYSDGEGTLAIGFSGKYSMTAEEASRRAEELEQEIAAILAGVPANATDYDKIKYVYDTIILDTEYDLTAPDNQNIYSVFVGKASVCQGYAKAAQLLLNRLGVDCTLVQGQVDTGEGHAWNLLRADGSFYYMDVTWGDASYQTESGETVQSQPVPEINYDYLCITTEELLRTHMPNHAVPLPECVAVEANYYVRESAFFSEYDREQLKRLFQKAGEEGREDVTVKCANESVYQTIREALIDHQEIFEYYPDSSQTVAYAQNDKQLSMTFWMTN